MDEEPNTPNHRYEEEGLLRWEGNLSLNQQENNLGLHSPYQRK